MADFGFWELALILFVALLVVGPERLPALASTLGLWLGRMRGIANQFKADFMNETRAGDLKKIMDDTRGTLGDAQRRINRQLRDTDPLVQSIEKQIESGRFTPDATAEPEAEPEPKAKAKPEAGDRAAPRAATPDAGANPNTAAIPDADENAGADKNPGANPDAGDVRADDRAHGRD